MTVDFLPALNAEIIDLQSQLEADPRFVKLRELKRIRALYGQPTTTETPEHNGSASSETAEASRADTTTEGSRATGRRASEERARLKAESIELLRGKTVPTSTGTLLMMLKERGFSVPGVNPGNSLSALLSQSKNEFKSHGRIGWTLIESV